MKTLTEFITMYKKPERWGLWTFEEFCDINNLNENTASKNAIEFYYNSLYQFLPDSKNGTYFDWINESLTSHNRELLINKLKDILGNYFIKIIDIKEKPMKVGVFAMEITKNCPIVDDNSTETFRLTNCSLSNKIYDKLQFFNYYITIIRGDYDSYIIVFEPLYTESANDVIRKNGNIVYHITDYDNLKTIMRTGLRPRVGKSEYDGGYRYFSHRIFLIGHSNNIKKNIKSVLKDKGYNDPYDDRYVLLKIDLKHHNIPLWFDDASAGELNVYTLTAIPPKLISTIKFDKL